MGNSRDKKSVHRYPRWWWSIGYLLCLFPLTLAMLAILHYIYVPESGTKGLGLLLIFCAVLIVFVSRAARKYQKLYSEIVVDANGISGPVIQSPDSFKRIRTNTFVPWNDVVTVEKFSGTDLDALRIGPTASGIRIFVKDGRILILDRIPGFQDIVEKIKQATDKRVHHVL